MLLSCSLAVVLSASIQLAQAVNIYLSPSSSFLRSTLPPDEASAALSRHLGLEFAEPLWGPSDLTHNEEVFVGQGFKNALVMTVEEKDVSAIRPLSLKHAFSLNTPPSSAINSLSSVVSTYLHRAGSSFDSIYSSYNFGDSDDVSSLVSFFEKSDEPSFAAVELAKLSDIGETYGRSSEEYLEVANDLRALLDQLVQDDRFSVALLSFSSSPSHFFKRDAPQETQAPLPPSTPPPQEPIGSISTCFTSLDACNNGTSSCSGRGQCLEASKAGRTCFVCSCGVTQTGEGDKVKTDYWAGESCERKDISGPFVLITGTVIVIILLIVGSISLLYTVGSQPLPSTLLATAAPGKKD